MANQNIEDHRWLASDNLLDCISNIQQYLVYGNTPGYLAGGLRFPTLAASAALSGTETAIAQAPLIVANTANPAEPITGTLSKGSRIYIAGYGTVTAATADKNNVFKLYMGTTGVLATDTAVLTATIGSVDAGTAVPFGFVLDLTVQTVGTGINGTAFGTFTYLTSSVQGTAAAANDYNAVTVSSSTMEIPTATYLTLSYTGFTTDLVSTFQNINTILYP